MSQDAAVNLGSCCLNLLLAALKLFIYQFRVVSKRSDSTIQHLICASLCDWQFGLG